MNQKPTYTELVIQELQRTAASIPSESIDELVNAILQSKQIFVAGAGRSGLMMRAFAMRLAHMGFAAYVVGETVTPGIQAQDLLIIGSGSGETKSLVAMAYKAKAIGAKVATATIVPQSTIGQLADVIVHVPAATKESAPGGLTTIQPMGSLYEQSILLLFDAMILKLIEIKEIDPSTLFGRHANLE
ncbi:3-hexulose-6-phosphate isomerase [compost metagenome]